MFLSLSPFPILLYFIGKTVSSEQRDNDFDFFSGPIQQEKEKNITICLLSRKSVQIFVNLALLSRELIPNTNPHSYRNRIDNVGDNVWLLKN